VRLAVLPALDASHAAAAQAAPTASDGAVRLAALPTLNASHAAAAQAAPAASDGAVRLAVLPALDASQAEAAPDAPAASGGAVQLDGPSPALPDFPALYASQAEAAPDAPAASGGAVQLDGPSPALPDFPAVDASQVEGALDEPEASRKAAPLAELDPARPRLSRMNASLTAAEPPGPANVPGVDEQTQGAGRPNLAPAAAIPTERTIAAVTGEPAHAKEVAQVRQRGVEESTAAEPPLVPGNKCSISEDYFNERVAAAIRTLEEGDDGTLRFFRDVLPLLGADASLKMRITNHIHDSLRKARWTPLTTTTALAELVSQTLSKDGGLSMNKIGSTFGCIFADKPRGAYRASKGKHVLAKDDIGVVRTPGGALRLIKLFADGHTYWTDAGGAQGSLAEAKPNWIINMTNLRR